MMTIIIFLKEKISWIMGERMCKEKYVYTKEK